MKTSIRTTVMCILFVTGMLSVSYGQQPAFLGIKGGLSIPNLSSGSSGRNEWNSGYSSRLGPYFGVLAEFRFSKLFAIQPEINYVAEGGKRSGIQPLTVPDQYKEQIAALTGGQDHLYADYKNVARINYIQVPILAKFNFPLGKSGRYTFFAQAGPAVSFLVSGKQVVKSSAPVKVYLDANGQQPLPDAYRDQFFGTGAIDTKEDIKDQLYKVNVGIQGGIGFALNYGHGKFFIEGGGNYGFLNIQKDETYGTNRIGAGTVVLGYAYHMK